MNKINIKQLIRPNIRDLVSYSSARSEYNTAGVIYLDANENSFGSSLGANYNRYPDPLQLKLKELIASIKHVDKECIFLGNGSDEPIDLLIRSFCEPASDNIILFPPTYGMYEVCAKINNVAVREILLTRDFQINTGQVLSTIDQHTKLIFICSPNNPTGNIINEDSIISILENFNGIVILDEAYIDFAPSHSFLNKLSTYSNLVILQTFSKAWGLAGLRLGMAFASPEIIAILSKVKAPYNINTATQAMALEAISSQAFINKNTTEIIKERQRLEKTFRGFSFLTEIFSSDANFILIKAHNANDLYNYLKTHGIIIRNRSNMPMCENCLRITVGTFEENNLLINTLNQYKDV